MKLVAEGASSIQIAAGQIAATTLLHANGVTIDQVAWAWSVYECWLDGCSGSSGIPPEEGAEIRKIWGQAQTFAIATACPHLAEAPCQRGSYQLYWYDPAPRSFEGWARFITDEEPPF